MCLSVEVKKKILKEVDEKILSKTEISKKYGIPKNSLSTILKSREKIVGNRSTNKNPSRKYFREAKHPQLEKALISWMRKMRGLNIPIDGNLLKEQSNSFALKLNIKDFKASDGWLQKFKSRHGLSFRKLCGESGTANTTLANEWKERDLKALLTEYAPEDVFNADETGLFFKMLPEKTLTFKGEKCSGGKKAKQRISILLAANMNGTQKLPLLFIGKNLKPRCFRNVNKLPAAYHANQNAWMTGYIYEKWLRDLDRQFVLEKRKILLIVDNCSAHVEVSNLKSIRVEFLPPNVTSILQPMDQGVINSFKRIYRRVLLQRVVMGLELNQPYEIDVLGAMHLSIRAWNDVQATTIAKAFQNAGFSTLINENQENVADDISGDELLINELRKRNPLLPEISFVDFLSVDSDVICTEEISDEEIIADAISEKEEELSDLEQEENEIIQRPTVKQAAQWLSGLRHFFEGNNNCEMISSIDKMETCIFQNVILKQKKISDYFHS